MSLSCAKAGMAMKLAAAMERKVRRIMDFSCLWFTKSALVQGKRLAAAIGCRAKLCQGGLTHAGSVLSPAIGRYPINNL
jgi:hypothetical protein